MDEYFVSNACNQKLLLLTYNLKTYLMQHQYQSELKNKKYPNLLPLYLAQLDRLPYMEDTTKFFLGSQNEINKYRLNICIFKILVFTSTMKYNLWLKCFSYLLISTFTVSYLGIPSIGHNIPESKSTGQKLPIAHCMAVVCSVKRVDKK